MRILAHLSDLHFGRTDPTLLAPLESALAALQPHLIVVSGDLTQRARRSQFLAARAFLDRLPAPRIVVPGNHDVPLFDIFTRFVRPLARYRRHISHDLEPHYQDQEIAVVGVNTARSLTVQAGRINRSQVDRLRQRLCNLDRRVVRFVVTHHPFEAPAGHAERKVVGRAAMALDTLHACGVDVCLAGHLHVSHVGRAAAQHVVTGHRVLLIQAGTATSTRERGEANAFNVIHVAAPTLRVDQHSWHAARGGFVVSASERFRREPDGWHPASSTT